MRIGIDLGGSHIGVGLITSNGEILIKKEKDFNHNEKENVEKTIEETIVKCIKEILEIKNLKISDIEFIGIATPGTVSDKIIIKATNLNIYNFNIYEMLKKYFDLDIILRNDAKCAALAENEYGVLKDYTSSVFLPIGTGIGGAVFYNNKLITPKKYPGFEFGHMIIQKDGNLCTCGKKGCFETYASMKKIKQDIIEELNLDGNIDGKTLLEIAKENESKIEQVINNYVENLSIGISNIINIFEPEAISLGGSFTYYKDILLNKLCVNIYKGDLLFNKNNEVKILLAKFNNDSGIIGATVNKST